MYVLFDKYHWKFHNSISFIRKLRHERIFLTNFSVSSSENPPIKKTFQSNILNITRRKFSVSDNFGMCYLAAYTHYYLCLFFINIMFCLAFHASHPSRLLLLWLVFLFSMLIQSVGIFIGPIIKEITFFFHFCSPTLNFKPKYV